MLGIVWDTTQFNNKAADWPAADGSQQPFVLSTGDPTGYGQHGDYVFGWKGDSLQKLMDDNKNCMGSACGGLKAQDAGKANACRVSGKVREECTMGGVAGEVAGDGDADVVECEMGKWDKKVRKKSDG